MLQFQYSDQAPTFRFSAKTKVITLPSYVKDLPKEQISIIHQFCALVREIYIEKVVAFTTQSVGKKMYPAMIRSASITEAMQKMEQEIGAEAMGKAYTGLTARPISPKTSQIAKPRIKSSTALDLIEDPFSI